MSPRTAFDFELNVLKQSVTEMGTRVESDYDDLFRALAEKDRETVESILRCDRIVNDMERGIEARCLSLITRQQPVAGDLRMVTASLKVVTDIKRIGNHISDMAELFLRLRLPDLKLFSGFLPMMIEETRKMVDNAVDAFVNRRIEDAKQVILYDDKVDDLFNCVKKDLITLLKAEKQLSDDCVDILMITKYLEKIGDHAVNIGEWEIFQETGSMEDTVLL